MQPCFAGLVAALVIAPPALADEFVVTSTRTATNSKTLAVSDNGLTISFGYRTVESSGQLSDWNAEADLDIVSLHCVAQQFRDVVAASADQATLDGLVELSHGTLFIGVVDTQQTTGHEYFGVTEADDALVISATLGNHGCTTTSAGRITSAIHGLVATARDSSLNELRAGTQTLLGRVRARAAKAR